MRDIIAGVFEGSAKNILESIGPEIADMGEVVDGRTAGIETDLSGMDGLEGLDAARH